MSGYTGFVPKAQKYLGQSYRTITRRALQDFAGEEKRMREMKNAPVSVARPEIRGKALATVYPRDSGLMPHYTGHIPGQYCYIIPLDSVVVLKIDGVFGSGEKFKYGTTFGYSTARVGVPQVQA